MEYTKKIIREAITGSNGEFFVDKKILPKVSTYHVNGRGKRKLTSVSLNGETIFTTGNKTLLVDNLFYFINKYKIRELFK